MRTYLNTLLHRKRGAYGPLWVFELDAETWAIVWSGWLEDEDICHLILSEDPKWFSRDWSMDGRRPNPTYKTQRDAMEEVIRSLLTMKVDLTHDEAEQRRYAVYISDAEHDLRRVLTGQQGAESPANELITQAPESVPALPEAAGATREHLPFQSPAEVEKTPPGSAPQAAEVNARSKPWDSPTETPKGLNFQPEAELHAKMNWVCNNVPKMSRLRILREGALMLCDHLISKHYREEE